MARRYDSKTNMFSPEGRLYQVEYAMEAIGQAGTTLGVLGSEGVVLAAERKMVHSLLDDAGAEKIIRLADGVAASVAGITSDADVLVQDLRRTAAVYSLSYGSEMPLEQLVKTIANKKQQFTQVGGKRPFGVSLLYAGWDRHKGFQLYQSDPSGNYSGWFATAIGANHQTAINLLKQEYKKDLDLAAAKALAIKTLSKTLDVKLAAEKVEMAALTRVDGKTRLEILSKEEVGALVKAHLDAEKAAAEEAKKKKTAPAQS